MAPSASTATATQNTASKDKTVRLTGRGSTPDASLQEQHRDPMENETKYRDFFWTYTEEPHRTRRLAIIKAHPEVCFTTWHRPCVLPLFEIKEARD